MTSAAPAVPPFLSVVVRTRGRRPGLLAEALASLSLQSDTDFEVCLVRHCGTDGDQERADRDTVQAVIAAAPTTVAHRVRSISAPPGRRGVPLNAGVAAASGRYVAFLDDDDLAGPEWVATFRAAATVAPPGALLRTRALAQQVRVDAASPTGCAVVGPPELHHGAPFDLVEHLYENRTPICALAWPRELFADGHIRVDEELGALEDWDLLLQATASRPVHDVAVATSIYRAWLDDGGSREEETAAGWDQARARVLARAAARPVTFGPHELGDLLRAAAELTDLRRFAAELVASGAAPAEPGGAAGDPTPVQLVRRAFTGVHERLAAEIAEATSVWDELVAVRSELTAARQQLELMERTVSWRVTAPLRALRGHGGGDGRTGSGQP